MQEGRGPELLVSGTAVARAGSDGGRSVIIARLRHVIVYVPLLTTADRDHSADYQKVSHGCPLSGARTASPLTLSPLLVRSDFV